MSDLIRREDVIKLVNQFVFGLCKEQNDEARKTFIKYIEKIPTAYDVNKVIEELESSKGLACEGRCCSECVYSSICMEGEQSERVAIDKAIEIVKQGGVSDDADNVCKWTKIDEEGYKNCKCNYDETIPDFFKYCPYCGKKIKIVGD